MPRSPRSSPDSDASPVRPTRWARRAAALIVALLCVLPFHRLLTVERNGPSGADALARGQASWSFTIWGALVVALVGVVAWVMARGGERRGGSQLLAGAAWTSLANGLSRPSTARLALVAALIAAGLSAIIAAGVYDRLLPGVDEMAQLIQARYLGAGSLGGQLPAGAEAWLIPNMLVTAEGWTSQYPPGHALVWAAFDLAGLGWAAGPALFGVLVGLVVASFDRLLAAEHRVHGRIAALLLAVSPFAVAIAAVTPSHVTAGAAGAAALYAALRADDGSRAWAFVAGFAVGIMVLARPWTGLVLGPTLTLGVWLQRGGAPLAARALGPWICGGIPSALLLFWYDAALFGSPFTLGYEALHGPAHGLGLHADPWSYPYGPREALAYTASDVGQLGAALLESPLSVTLLGAAYLTAARSLPSGLSVVAAWALLPVAANAAYWFHAPRMLFEAAPAWLLLAVLAVTRAHERAGPALRAGIAGGTAITLVVAVPFGAARVRAQAWNEETLSRIASPQTSEPSLVFVHAPWDERIASMLQAAGMRNDSIQPVLRRNDSCALHGYAVARLSGAPAAELPPIDLAQTPEPRDGLRFLLLQGGTRVSRLDGHDWSATCAPQAAADRFGSVALAPLLWQGDLPGLEDGRPMFVRDHGPDRNRAVLSAYPDRRPLVWGYASADGPPTLMPYERAMSLLWGSAASGS